MLKCLKSGDELLQEFKNILSEGRMGLHCPPHSTMRSGCAAYIDFSYADSSALTRSLKSYSPLQIVHFSEKS